MPVTPSKEMGRNTEKESTAEKKEECRETRDKRRIEKN